MLNQWKSKLEEIIKIIINFISSLKLKEKFFIICNFIKKYSSLGLNVYKHISIFYRACLWGFIGFIFSFLYENSLLSFFGVSYVYILSVLIPILLLLDAITNYKNIFNKNCFINFLCIICSIFIIATVVVGIAIIVFSSRKIELIGLMPSETSLDDSLAKDFCISTLNHLIRNPIKLLKDNIYFGFLLWCGFTGIVFSFAKDNTITFFNDVKLSIFSFLDNTKKFLPFFSFSLVYYYFSNFKKITLGENVKILSNILIVLLIMFLLILAFGILYIYLYKKTYLVKFLKTLGKTLVFAGLLNSTSASLVLLSSKNRYTRRIFPSSVVYTLGIFIKALLIVASVLISVATVNVRLENEEIFVLVFLSVIYSFFASISTNGIVKPVSLILVLFEIPLSLSTYTSNIILELIVVLNPVFEMFNVGLSYILLCLFSRDYLEGETLGFD